MSGGQYPPQQGQPGQYPPQPGQYPPQPGQYPPQPGQYPPQPGQYPPQPGQYPPGYDPYNPYGHQQPGMQPYYGYVPPGGLPTECFGGFWMRVVAYLVDVLILIIPSLAIQAMIYAMLGVSFASAFELKLQPDPRAELAGNISTVAAILLAAAYFVFFTVRFGGTPGKMTMGLRIVDEGGIYLTVGRAIGRYFAEILSGCLLLIGYIMVGFHPRKQGLHDLICSTYVVRKEYVNPTQSQHR